MITLIFATKRKFKKKSKTNKKESKIVVSSGRGWGGVEE